MSGLLTAPILNGRKTVTQAVLRGSPDGQTDINDKDDCGSGSANYNTHAPAIEIESLGFLPVTAPLRSRDAGSIRRYGW